MALIDDLKTLRVDFAAHENTTRAALYEIVGRCFTLLCAYTEDTVPLHEAAAELGVTVGSTTDPALIVVRIVFETEDRRRASAIASVLRVAMTDSSAVEAQGMAAWILAKGGLEAIRKAASKNVGNGEKLVAKSQAHLRAVGLRVLKAKASSAFASIPAKALADQKLTPEGFILMVGYRDAATNGINVVAFDNDEKRINDLLTKAGQEPETKEIKVVKAKASSALEAAAAAATVEA